MVLVITSFHLFGITPLICTPSLIRNFETTFAHPTRRKIFIPSLIWTRDTVLDTHLSGFLKNIFCPSLICNGNTVLDTQNAKKYLHPSLIRTEEPQMHTLFEKNFHSLTYLQWEGVFFKSVCKNSFHLFPQSDRKLSGVLKKIAQPQFLLGISP